MTETDAKDCLVVVSKLKAHVKSCYGLSTSGNVPDVITKAVEQICAQAAENAKKDGRKTLMDRDFTMGSGCC
jgi:histone H3/H4